MGGEQNAEDQAMFQEIQAKISIQPDPIILHCIA